MGFVFDRDAARTLEDWYSTEAGRETLRRQQLLVRRLLRLRPGQRLLDVGCGCGVQIDQFKKAGLDVTGLDPSWASLDLAQARLGHRAGLFPGRAEDLPFEDNEFDLVTLINTLEYVDDPEAALREAVRVARRQVFLGVDNGLSLTAVGRRIRQALAPAKHWPRRHFTIWELTHLVRKTAGPSPVHWGAVGLLPAAMAGRADFLEKRSPVRNNPFGDFLGVSVTVKYTTQADNLIVDAPLKLNKTVPHPSPTSLTALPGTLRLGLSGGGPAVEAGP